MVGLAVYFPRLPTDLVRRWRHLDHGSAVVLSRNQRQAEVVAAVSLSAERLGVTIGMSLANAQVLLSAQQSHVEAIDDHGIAWTLRRIAVRMQRWVPVVAVDGADGLLCDVSGCERLYRSIDRLVQGIARKMQQWGVAARVAAAPTFGAAWGLARYGESAESVTACTGLSASLDPLPLAALRLESSTLDSMRRVGLERIDQARRVPRAALADRYGESVLNRLDQALGRLPETITPMRPGKRVAAERVFDGPTDRLETIALAARGVLANICAQLLVRECGCRLLELRLDRSDLTPLTLTVRTAKASRDAKHLWSLIGPKLDKAQLGFGVQAVAMAAKALGRLPHLQTAHWTEREAVDDAQVGRLVDTLAARLGPASILTLRIAESHLPEAAFGYDPVQSVPAGDPAVPAVAQADRPTHLHEPVPIEVSLLVPNGPIAIVRIGRQALRVTSGIGPERIESEWWRDAHPPHSRDYFKVGVEDGRVLWIFRCRTANQADTWFLHGEWV
jgi:protein ImuB